MNGSTCEPACVHGTCGSPDLRGTGGDMNTCVCYPMWSGKACDVHWVAMWGQKYTIAWVFFICMFSLLLVYALWVLWRARRHTNRRDVEGKCACTCQTMNAAQFCVLVLMFACAVQIFAHIDEMGYRQIYPYPLCVTFTGLAYISLFSACLALLFAIQDVLQLRVYNYVGTYSTSRRWRFVGIIVFALVTVTTLEVVMAQHPPAPAWARFSFLAVFCCIFLSLCVASAHAARQLFYVRSELLPTFNSTGGGRAPFEMLLRTLGRLTLANSVIVLAYVVFVLTTFIFEYPRHMQEITFLDWCVWQTVECVIVILNLLAFSKLTSPEHEPDAGAAGEHRETPLMKGLRQATEYV